jgi:hypothetical protein
MIKVFLFMSLGITSLIFGFILGRKIFGPIHSFKLVYLENSKEKILIFLPMLIGLFIYGVNILILMAQNNSITLASYVWLILFYRDLSSSFFIDFIISIYLFFTMLIFLLFSSINGFGKFQLKAKNIKT